MRFVDPDAALKARLRVLSARRFAVDGDPRTYLRVVVGARAGLKTARLRARTESGDRALLPLGGQTRAPCRTDATCFEIVAGPGLLPPATDAVELEVPALGHRSSGPLTQARLGPYAIEAEAIEANETLRVRMTRDPIAERLADEPAEGAPPFARGFEAAVAPGPCGAAARGPWREVEGFPADVDAALDAGGRGCVAVRPRRPPGGPAVALRTVRARALVQRFRHVYQPPEVAAPLVWLVLFDLELPSPSRCRRAQEALRDAVDRIAREIAAEERRPPPALGLSPVEIAVDDGVPCRQPEGRSFDPEAVARRAAQELEAASLPASEVRLLLIYATNLAARSPGVVNVLVDLEDALAARGLGGSYLVAVGPEIAVTGVGAEGRIPWVSTLEPAFADALFEVLGRAWPFRSVGLGERAVVPLTDASSARAIEAFRICDASADVEPLGARVGTRAYRPVDGAPAYRVRLPPQRLVESAAFERPIVEVTWESCRGLCDRPAPGRPRSSTWLAEEGSCAP